MDLLAPPFCQQLIRIRNPFLPVHEQRNFFSGIQLHLGWSRYRLEGSKRCSTLSWKHSIVTDYLSRLARSAVAVHLNMLTFCTNTRVPARRSRPSSPQHCMSARSSVSTKSARVIHRVTVHESAHSRPDDSGTGEQALLDPRFELK